MLNLKKYKNEFHQKGYCVVNDIFDQISCKKYSDYVNEIYEESNRKKLPIKVGINNHKPIWDIVVKKELINLIEFIFENKIFFLYQSGILQSENSTYYLHHRDNPCRRFGKGYDWNEKKDKYNIVRVGIYLNDFKETNFNLNIIPDSHRKNHNWREILRFIHKSLKRKGINDKYINFLVNLFGKKLNTTSGTCVIFDPRLYHSPSPHFKKRNAIFLSYGVNNLHSNNFISYFTNLRTDHDGLYRDTFGNKNEFNSFLKSKNLLYPDFIKPDRLENAFLR